MMGAGVLQEICWLTFDIVAVALPWISSIGTYEIKTHGCYRLSNAGIAVGKHCCSSHITDHIAGENAAQSTTDNGGRSRSVIGLIRAKIPACGSRAANIQAAS